MKASSRLQIGIKLLDQMDKEFTKLKKERAKAKDALFFGGEKIDNDFDSTVGQPVSGLPEKLKKQVDAATANFMVPYNAKTDGVNFAFGKDSKLGANQSVLAPLRTRGSGEVNDFLSSAKITGYSREILIRMPYFDGKTISISEISI